jgi:cobalamin biosynthesis protein CobD/CbiB
MIHLFFSAISAAATLAWERQIKKAKDAHRFIKESIHSERKEIEQLISKYTSRLNKERDVSNTDVNDVSKKKTQA